MDIALDRLHIVLNGLSLPANVAKERVKGAARPLFMRSNQEGWPLICRGSCTLYSAYGNKFAAYTRHQHVTPDASWQLDDAFVCLEPQTDDAQLKFLRGDRIESLPSSSESEQTELILMRLPKYQVDEHRRAQALFIENPNLSVGRPPGDILFVAVGYPDALSSLVLHDDDERIGWLKQLNLVQVSVRVQWDGLTSEDLVDEYHFQPGAALSGVNTYSGFSGAPIVGFDRSRRDVFLAGIIITGGRGIFRALNVAAVNRLCSPVSS